MAHSELLRYLGYGGQEIGPDLEARIDAAEARCVEIARPAMVRRTFAADALPLELPGHDIARHLSDATEVVLLAVTLGLAVDRELRKLSLTDPLGQMLFDAAATYAIEREVDRVEGRARAEAAERGLYCSWRFSPGYGDLPLDVQATLLAVLDATRRLGITLTDGNLMAPTKSVTAIIGIHPTPQPGLASSCAVCSLLEFCSLRTRGMRCS